jgi:hypothetical protein
VFDLHTTIIYLYIDVWGQIHRRYGGGPSYLVENAKAMHVIDYLDPPHPTSKRLASQYRPPFFFTTADRTPPNRMRSPASFKINRFYTYNNDDQAMEEEIVVSSPNSTSINNNNNNNNNLGKFSPKKENLMKKKQQQLQLENQN